MREILGTFEKNNIIQTNLIGST